MIYADYNATAFVTKDHLQEVFSILEHSQGNSSSAHIFGRRAKLALETARKNVAKLFSCNSENIIFTSSATEANNLIIHSFLQKTDAHTKKILTSSVEHPSVLNPIKLGVRKKLCEAYYCQVDSNCLIDVSQIEYYLKNKKIDLVCLIHVQNEVGTINDIQAISKMIKKISKDTHIHVDAVQSLGKLDLQWLGSSCIDSASFSAHKIGGLPGVGCLYIKKRGSLLPLILGGGQELGIRAGTENLPGIISFGCISRYIQTDHYLNNLRKISLLKEKLLDLLEPFSNIMIHGSKESQVTNTISLHIKKANLQKILLSFEREKIAISTKSACSSGMHSPSYTLQAMGLSDEIATNSIRISLGSCHTEKDILMIAKILISHANHN